MKYLQLLSNKVKTQMWWIFLYRSELLVASEASVLKLWLFVVIQIVAYFQQKM